ncbi:MAG TPA: Ni/Fe hydrogenase subunit alpha [Candidatus Aminicenantes bacterium]|jgi:NAD-reducing hydrogenase large subunit|nr:Ni/Fe hydrogenase subunit alpha [Acidobacteriota bacterium]HOU48138.1 Ni/Fe hydrogenase subunit alpha [Candidatus Aminicenantes bacterium]HQH44982.1 Ni/Fe hydrogenase subunit alpha [Candidatus Aminicenantes bacterium]HQJ42407.1 Ni/Fe hydrogenase subunit alpha [Candidatus Aminicenantes bacterium]
MARKIVIEPVTRVEGHGKVTIRLDDRNNVASSRLHIVEFRGFERFVQGRPYWEAPVLVQRLCGICPVSHHLAAAKAMDQVIGVEADGLSPTAEKMRRLMHYGQMFQSHALHFFHLAAPDLLFGADADPAVRNVIGIALTNKELATRAVLLRKFGQEVILATAGKKIHGTGAVPGGINKNLSIEERDALLQGAGAPAIETMIDWAEEAVEFLKDYHAKNRALMDGFAAFPSNHLGLVGRDGALDFYHGAMRAVDAGGKRILDDVDYRDYLKYIAEEVRTWSYMKFPYLKSLGKAEGWYRVGPLARLNVCDFIPTPRAQKQFEAFRAYTGGKPNNMSLHMHWARLIELLHSGEVIRELLLDPDLQKTELVRKGRKRGEGVGLVEAPRGTLFHHYRVDENDQISMANLIVSTTNNNEPMNRAVHWVAMNVLSGKRDITEGMLNRVEIAIRAYDPCLSCATHALGRMPLAVELYDAGGNLIDRKAR